VNLTKLDEISQTAPKILSLTETGLPVTFMITNETIFIGLIGLTDILPTVRGKAIILTNQEQTIRFL
jgi:hypothetical protein